MRIYYLVIMLFSYYATMIMSYETIIFASCSNKLALLFYFIVILTYFTIISEMCHVFTLICNFSLLMLNWFIKKLSIYCNVESSHDHLNHFIFLLWNNYFLLHQSNKEFVVHLISRSQSPSARVMFYFALLFCTNMDAQIIFR